MVVHSAVYDCSLTPGRTGFMEPMPQVTAVSSLVSGGGAGGD